MTYPQAILIAVAVLAGAFLVGRGLNAQIPSQGQIAITSISGRSPGGQVFIARGDGQVRFCIGYPLSQDDLFIRCSQWK